MVAFRSAPEEWTRLDWFMLRDGGVTLYWRQPLFQADLAWLAGEGYRIVEFECSAWTTKDRMHLDLAERLSFPDYYGHNLDALSDCLSSIEVPAAGGCALALRRFDVFANGTDHRAAEAVLDIVVTASRQFLLTGQRLVALIQTDDPDLSFGPLGAIAAGWNRHELLNSARRQ
jgi:RNAse (barnase) inhibitor barstar